MHVRCAGFTFFLRSGLWHQRIVGLGVPPGRSAIGASSRPPRAVFGGGRSSWSLARRTCAPKQSVPACGMV